MFLFCLITMNSFVQFAFLAFCVCLVECNPQRSVGHGENVPIISNDCQYFRNQCSLLCFNDVENDQCWGSPRYAECTCVDGLVHYIPGFECTNPECPKYEVIDGTTKSPVVRKRKPFLKNRQSPPPADPNFKPVISIIIEDECKDFRSQCSVLCKMNVENDQCWGSPTYRQCVCTTGLIHFIPGHECKHNDCPKEEVIDGTTKSPIVRKRKPLIRRRKPQTN